MLDANLRRLDATARLSQLELMFPGDACEDKGDSECLLLLQGVYMSLADADRLTTMCETWTTDSSLSEEGSAASSTCAECDGLDTSSCVAVLSDELTALSDKDRLVYLRANVPGADLGCSGLTEKDCLSQLDAYVAAASDDALLSLYSSDCHSLTAGLDNSKYGVGNTKWLADASWCGQCDGLDDAACVALLNDELTALSDKNRLTYLRTIVPEADSLCDGQTDKSCLSLLDSYMETGSDTTLLAAYSSDCDSLLVDSTSTATFSKAGKSQAASTQEFVVDEGGVTAKDSAGALSLLAVVAAAVAVIVLGVKGAQAVRRRGYEKVAVADPDHEAGPL